MRLLTSFLLLAAGLSAQPKSPLRFEISWAKPMDGHVVLIVSSNPQTEPRFQINGYSGGPPGPESSGTIHQRLMPVMLEHMLKTAPAGADVKSWRY